MSVGFDMPLTLLPQVTQAPAPPAPPATPAPGGAAPLAAPTSVGGLVSTVPRTTAEVSALRAQRSELSNQLSSAAGRREELVKDLEGATGANRAGIESRIQLLDTRILQIERDIASTGQLLASARGQILQTDPTQTTREAMQIDLTAIIAILSVFVLFPLALTYARNMWRKGSMPKVDDQLARENSDRLQRLESAVDSIAIEVERISEGQRFVTKLLAETQGKERLQIEQPRS